MAESGNEPISPEAAQKALSTAAPSPTEFQVELVEPPSMRVYQILEQDLVAIQGAGDRETLGLAFFCLCGGALASAILSWIGAPKETTPVYLAAAIALTVATGFLGLFWKIERQSRQRLVKAVQERDKRRVIEVKPQGR